MLITYNLAKIILQTKWWILFLVYKDMKEAMQKHSEVDVLVNFASLRSAYDATIETLNFEQVLVFQYHIEDLYIRIAVHCKTVAVFTIFVSKKVLCGKVLFPVLTFFLRFLLMFFLLIGIPAI